MPTATNYIAPNATRQIKIENGVVTVSVEIKDAKKSIALHEIAPAGWKIVRGTDNAFAYKDSTNEWIWNGTESEMKVTYTLIKLPGLEPACVSGLIIQADGHQSIVNGDIDIKLLG